MCGVGAGFFDASSDVLLERTGLNTILLGYANYEKSVVLGGGECRSDSRSDHENLDSQYVFIGAVDAADSRGVSFHLCGQPGSRV